MKIFQINICPDLSTGSLMMRIAQELQKCGHSVLTSAAPKNGTDFTNHYVIGSMFERHVNIALGKYLGSENAVCRHATKQLIKKIQLENPDIIHLHNIHQYFVNYSMLLKFLTDCNIPVIWTLHDCWAFTGACHYYTEESCNKWQKQCRNCPYIKHQKTVLFDFSKSEFNMKKKIYNKMENLFITTPSEWLADEVKNSILSSKDITVICNGIDTVRFSHKNSDIRKKYGLEEKFIILSVASHWSKNKGLHDFIKLAHMLDASFKIVIIGIDSNTEKESHENILYLERTSNLDTLAEWYSAADVYCSLSTEESFGLVVAEAMSCGTPAVVYNSTASPELVKGTDSFVCAPHDLDSVKQAIETIKRNGKHSYYDKCRQKVLDEYEINATVAQFIELYRQIVDRRSI